MLLDIQILDVKFEASYFTSVMWTGYMYNLMTNIYSFVLYIIKILNVYILSLFSTSFDIRIYLPIALALMYSIFYFFKNEQLNIKKSFLWYIFYFLITLLFLSISTYCFSKLEIQNIISNSLLPATATEVYNGKSIQDLLSMNSLNPNDWGFNDKRILLDRLINNFNSFSIDCTKGEAAYCKLILQKNNVQEPWVQFNNSNTNRFPLYRVLRNSEYQDMILKESDVVDAEILKAKFKVGNENRSILN